MASKSLVHTFMMKAMMMAMMGMTTASTRASRAFSVMLMARAATSITGARTSIRRPMASIMVMALTSLVIRVMREAEEKRSMSAKEKDCTLSNRAWRRLPPKPWLAKEAYLALRMPQVMEMPASASMARPS